MVELEPDVLEWALNHRDDALRTFDKADCEESLHDFCRVFWSVNEPDRPFMETRHGRVICEHLEAVSRSQIKRLSINIPPGFGKSLYVGVLWPSWEWGPFWMPGLRYIGASYAQALSLRDNVRMRRIITSELYREMWPHVKLTGDVAGKEKFENTRTGFRECTSVGGVGTGARCNRFIIDDPNSVKKVESDVIRYDSNHWLAEVVPTRLNDKKRDAIVNVQQRTHVGDCSGMIISADLPYEHLILPMHYSKTYHCFTAVRRQGVEPERRRCVVDLDDVPRWEPDPDGSLVYSQDDRTEEGDLLCPQLVDEVDILELEKEMSALGGSYAISAQLEQRPTFRKGGMFQQKDFQIIDECPPLSIAARGWDLAATSARENPQAAYTAGVKCGIAADGRLIVADVRRIQGSEHEVNELLKLTAAQDGAYVEQDLPQDPGSAGKAQKAALARLLHGVICHFSTETGEKSTRALPLSGQAEAGNVYLVRSTWNDPFIQECCSFRPRARLKDQVDAWSRCYARLLVMMPRMEAEFVKPEVVR